MGWLRKSKSKREERTGLLRKARRAAARRSHAKAAVLYERLWKAEPDNVDLLRRLAIQRALAGQGEAAWRDCHHASNRLLERGFTDQAIGVLRAFARHLPGRVDVWSRLADLEVERGRHPDAVEVLLEGRRAFRSSRQRAVALSLLWAARRIDPHHFEANYELAKLMARSGGIVPARRILEGLAPYARGGRERRRLRWRLFCLSPTPAAAWAWMRAVVNAKAPVPIARVRHR